MYKRQASISDGTGRLPEQIDVYEDRVTGRTEGAVRAFDFLTERVPKLEKKSFAYRDKDRCGDYDTFYEGSSPAKALAMAINRILGGEYDMKWEFGKDYWGCLLYTSRPGVHHRAHQLLGRRRVVVHSGGIRRNGQRLHPISAGHPV